MNPVQIQRFLSRIAVGDGCWEWQGGMHYKGYGLMWVGSKLKKAHRLSYELFVGPIPEGLVTDHLCRNRACVRPSHLEPVTPKINSQRGINYQSQKTHCRNGHPYDGENVYWRSGERTCRTCHRETQRRYVERQRAREISAP